ncbi:MAG: SpoIID/LytB domain-containing protein [Pyrinomonadaceae bacterium]
MKTVTTNSGDPSIDVKGLLEGVGQVSGSVSSGRAARGPGSESRVKPKFVVAVAIVGVILALIGLGVRLPVESAKSSQGGEDAALLQAAIDTLHGRQGTVIIMDAQSGRVRAVVNPQTAFESQFMPGSTIKPFTALTAMRTGALRADSRLMCRQKYAHGSFDISCVHPKDQPAFNAEQALAYSCNYFFGKLGEHIAPGPFNSTLSSFGFGTRTGIGGDSEGAGQLPHGAWESRNAIGEAPTELVTPIQLITAYAALVNGGKLYFPAQAPADGFTPRLRRQIEINDEHRSILIRGMRGAVEYGTAASANLSGGQNYIFGKTGTSDGDGGQGTQGWFVGFDAPRDATKSEVEPTAVQLVVLVFIKGANGKECAATSRAIFDEFARKGSRGEAVAREPTEGQRLDPVTRTSAEATVKVHMVTEKETRELPIEEYVLGVISAEGSIEPEVEALKALAIAARTYGLKHLHRHEGAGYDFCSTTHCQRFVPVNFSSASPLAVRAVNETRGQVLLDEQGQIIDSFYSASCGGASADVRSLWGTAGKSYLRTSPDPYCVTEAHAEWTDHIANAELARALAVDPRTNVGPRISDLRISKRDASGRAEFITIMGDRTRQVRGWDFKLIVGRTLGWNWLKSSRFTLNRSGGEFVFRGNGFGHGLGLCQEGAHVMAERGAKVQQILDQYYPGTKLGRRG